MGELKGEGHDKGREHSQLTAPEVGGASAWEATPLRRRRLTVTTCHNFNVNRVKREECTLLSNTALSVKCTQTNYR